MDNFDNYQTDPEVRAALEAYLLENPLDIGDFPDAPEELQMMCVKADPWSFYYIKNPYHEVMLEAYRRESNFIKLNSKPTEEQQVAAASGSYGAYLDIKNPCRAAVLIILDTYGAYFKDLSDLQVKLGTQFAASTIALKNDVELQAAGLSNITGSTLFHEHPELFDREGLNAAYPRLLGILDTWAVLGNDSRDFELIRESLREAKSQTTPEMQPVQLPVDRML